MSQLLLVLAIPLIARFVVRYQQTHRLLPVWYLSRPYRDFLHTHFRFYQKLPATSKKIFEKKVALFIASKRFIPRNMDNVTPEMKALVAAAAVQLTFGLPKVNLSFFRNILLFPESFYSPSNQTFHKGEVNPKMRAIVLSWKDLVEGYLTPNGRNLGLHEMAHALRLENKVLNHEYGFLDKRWLHQWEQYAQHTIAEINEGNETFFRKYGGTNHEEFFSVAVENFFERPLRFKEKHPLTYAALCKLLRQDPALLEKG